MGLISGSAVRPAKSTRCRHASYRARRPAPCRLRQDRRSRHWSRCTDPGPFSGSSARLDRSFCRTPPTATWQTAYRGSVLYRVSTSKSRPCGGSEPVEHPASGYRSGPSITALFERSCNVDYMPLITITRYSMPWQSRASNDPRPAGP